MKRSVFAFAVLSLSATAALAAPDKGLAPAATRTPSAQPRQPACNSGTGAACAQAASTAGSAQQYRSALAASRPGEDIELNSGVTRVMGDLLAAGRCGDAVSLARREGLSDLAARAQQLCK